MKSLPASTVVRATLAAAAPFSSSAFWRPRRDRSFRPSRARGRRRLCPPAEVDGVHLTLEQAVALALANNTDLDVTINAAESFQYQLISSKGIFDPLLQGFVNRNHNRRIVSNFKFRTNGNLITAPRNNKWQESLSSQRH